MPDKVKGGAVNIDEAIPLLIDSQVYTGLDVSSGASKWLDKPGRLLHVQQPII